MEIRTSSTGVTSLSHSVGEYVLVGRGTCVNWLIISRLCSEGVSGAWTRPWGGDSLPTSPAGPCRQCLAL
jgi:hypothetical protein